MRKAINYNICILTTTPASGGLLNQLTFLDSRAKGGGKNQTTMKVLSDKQVNTILENTSRIQRQIELISKSIPVQFRHEIINVLTKEIEAIFKEPQNTDE